MTRIKPGQLLLAEPFLFEGEFKRSVVLIAEHGRKGSLGLILNKPSDLILSEIIPDFPDFDVPVYIGGPVGQDRLNYIHTMGDLLDDSKEIVKGIYWGGNFDKLKFLIDTKQITSNQIRFFVGYSGWAVGQLKAEVQAKSWILSQATPALSFHEKPENLWRFVLNSLGARYSVFATMPDDYSLN